MAEHQTWEQTLSSPSRSLFDEKIRDRRARKQRGGGGWRFYLSKIQKEQLSMRQIKTGQG